MNDDPPPEPGARSSALIPLSSSLLFPGDFQQVQPAAVGAQHLEREIVDADLLPALGNPAEARRDEPADGVVIFVAEGRAERRVDIGDLGERLDAVVAAL